MKRKKNLNVKFFAAILVLSALAFSLTAPPRTFVRAEAATDAFEINSENTGALKKADYGKMPLLFEANKGQTDRRAKFVLRGAGYTLYLTEREAVFSLKVSSAEFQDSSELVNPKTAIRRKTKSDVLRMKFVGANANPAIEGADEALTKTNYYIGRKRIENLPNYRKVNYKNLYRGIDAVFYGNAKNQLEYDFTVAPNADANQIKLNFDGARAVSIDGQGNLVVKTENTEIVQQKPFAYQTVNGEKREVEARYVINEQSQITNRQSQISFALGDYDKSQPLVIDPALDYLTYIGGTAFDQVFEVAADTQLNAYITGSTSSLDFHGEARNDNDGTGIFVAKINPDGSQFVYVTILEGNGDDFGVGIALNANNEAFVTGTASRFFPTTSGAYDTNHGINNANDAFVTKLNASGNIAYSSFLGGADNDQAFDVAVDGGGKAYVVGTTRSSTGFPKKNEFAGCGFGIPMTTNSFDAFLTVFNSSGSDITYSTCFGGGGYINTHDDDAFSVALDSSNNAYITGSTNANNFQTKNAAQSEIGGGRDAFIVKFNPASSGDASLIYSTYLGGSGTDHGFGIAVSANGTASVTGITGSFNFPLQNAFDTTNQINEAFIAQYNSSGTKLNSTFLGGSDQDQGLNIALGNGGTIYVTGNTLSNDFPMAAPFQAARRGARDAFVAKVRFGVNNNPGVASSSYLGGGGNEKANGIAVRGNFIFIGGETQSNNLLTTGGVIKPNSTANSTNPDGFVAKILDTRLDTVGVFDPTNTVFELKNTLTGGAPDIAVDRGAAGDVPVAGDFNGDGIDTVSTFNNGVWRIQNINNIVSGYPTGPITVNFGQAGDLPVVGDWNGDGVDTPGVFRPSVGDFLLTNSTATNPPVEITVDFGQIGDLPVAGDWDADGVDSTGVFRPSAGQFFLTNDNVFAATVDVAAFFGIAEDLPIAGDWDGNGVDTIGIWRPSAQLFVVSNDNASIAAQFAFGQNGDQPVAGDWNGKPN